MNTVVWRKYLEVILFPVSCYVITHMHFLHYLGILSLSFAY